MFGEAYVDCFLVLFLSLFKMLFIFGCTGASLLLRRLSLSVTSKGYSLVAACGLFIAVASLVEALQL